MDGEIKYLDGKVCHASYCVGCDQIAGYVPITRPPVTLCPECRRALNWARAQMKLEDANRFHCSIKAKDRTLTPSVSGAIHRVCVKCSFSNQLSPTMVDLVYWTCSQCGHDHHPN